MLFRSVTFFPTNGPTNPIGESTPPLPGGPVIPVGNAPPPPPTADNKNIQTNSGTPVTITLTGTEPIPGDVLKFSVVANPAHGTLTAPTSNTVTYTPNTGFSGTDSFTYKATDGQ